MIASLSGQVSAIEHGSTPSVVILVQGVGYKVFCSPRLASQISIEQELTLQTHLVVKEGVLDLFGFESLEERSVFTHLIGVSGVGPKTAIGMLNSTAQQILSAIEQGDVSFFTQFPRVGKRMAHNIIIELKTSAAELTALGLTTQSPEFTELHDALTALGYQSSKVLAVLRDLDTTQSESVVMKQAIRRLTAV